MARLNLLVKEMYCLGPQCMVGGGVINLIQNHLVNPGVHIHDFTRFLTLLSDSTVAC